MIEHVRIRLSQFPLAGHHLRILAIAIPVVVFLAVPGAAAAYDGVQYASAAAPPSQALPDAGFSVLAILAFVSGVLSFTSPCTLPILPAYFAFTFQAGRKQVAMMTLSFFMGLATLFVLLGASASAIGNVLNQNINLLTRVGGAAIVVFGVMTLFGKGFTGLQVEHEQEASVLGSFLFGATFALGWTSCIGPILAGLLILAASGQTVLQGALLLFIYALGLGLPLIIVSTFFGRMDRNSLPWRILRGKGWELEIADRTLFLHSTSVVSGVLFIALGWMMYSGYLTLFNRFIPVDLQVWFLGVEERLITLFQG